MIYFLAFLAGAAVSPMFGYFPYASAALVAAAAVYFLKKKKYAVIALIALGLLYPSLRNSPSEGLPFKSGAVTVTGHFAAPPVKLRGGYSQEFELPGGGRIDVLSGEEFETGREHELKLRVITPAERKNPGAIKPGQYAVLGYVKGTGEVGSSAAVFFNRLRQRINGAVAERFEPEAASLIMAVTTGQQANMSYALKDSFRASGVAHLLSISGTHFGLLFVLLFGGFRAAVKFLPTSALERLTLHLTLSQAAALLCFPFLLLYLGISGGSVPTVRSFIMVSLFLLGLFLGRKGRWWLNFLVVAALALVLWAPAVTASISFQLSFLAVLFIGFFLSGTPKEKEAALGDDAAPKEGRLRSALKYPLTSVVITIAATLGVEPLIAYYFHYSSLVSPLANMVVTPLVCMVLVPLSVAGSFVYLLTGTFPLASLTGWVAGASIYLVKAFSSVPYSAVSVPPFPVAALVFYYLGFLLYFVFRDRRLLAVPALAVLVPLSAMAFSGKALSVTFLDAGGVSPAVVELPDGKVIVVDAGRRGKEVGRYLRHRGLRRMDALVLTRAGQNHIGGAASLAEQFPIDEIWDGGGLEYPEDFPKSPARRSLARGDVVEGEGYAIEVLHAGGAGEGPLVLRVKGKEKSFLLAGDIGESAAENLAALGKHIDSDVVLLSGHSIPAQAQEEFLREVSPSVAVVMGKRGEETGGALIGARVLYTLEDGAVRVEETGGGLAVRTYDEMRLHETLNPAEEMRNIGRLFMSW